jgi:hypothetical protein
MTVAEYSLPASRAISLSEFSYTTLLLLGTCWTLVAISVVCHIVMLVRLNRKLPPSERFWLRGFVNFYAFRIWRLYRDLYPQSRLHLWELALNVIAMSIFWIAMWNEGFLRPS